MQVPYWQSKIVQGCRKRGKPVIVATNMLESMIDNPTPTRAEVRMQPCTLPCCASDLLPPSSLECQCFLHELAAGQHHARHCNLRQSDDQRKLYENAAALLSAAW